MKYIQLLTILLILASQIFAGSPEYKPKSGDILFQDLNSSQSIAVKLATGSEYTHCGILFEKDGKFVVYEAVGPVKITPLKEWIDLGINDHYVVRRYSEETLTDKTLSKMKNSIKPFLGKNYDIYFNWSDDELYCSELVWKAFKLGADIELAPLRELKTYDLSHPAVKAKLTERYGDKIPLEEPVIAPSDLFESELMTTVYISEHSKSKKTKK